MTEVQDRTTVTSPLLNHVEFAHRPGESHLVLDLFESLAIQCAQIDAPPFGKYIVIHLGSSHGENDMFVSEVEPEQLAVEDAMQGQISAGGSDLATAYTQYRTMLEERPYRATHVGIRFASVADFDAVIQRLESISAEKLAGRLVVGDIISRSAEEAQGGYPVKQVWIWTDVISTGLLSMGQQIELQTYAF